MYVNICRHHWHLFDYRPYNCHYNRNILTLGFCWMPTTHNLRICCLPGFFFISNYLSNIYAEHPVCPIIFYLSTGVHFMESKNCIKWPSLTNYNLQLSARETWYMETFWKKTHTFCRKKMYFENFSLVWLEVQACDSIPLIGKILILLIKESCIQ